MFFLHAPDLILAAHVPGDKGSSLFYNVLNIWSLMKNLIAILLTVLSLSFTKSASAQQWFNVNVQLQYNRTTVSAVIFNNYNRPIMCRGIATGVTYQGTYLESYFNNVVIYPGANAYAYVYTNVNAPFVNADSSAQCIWY